MSQTNAQLLADSLGTASTGTVPIGGIILWSGSVATIPDGYALCNGSNGTPDLKNKFILGAYSDDASVAYPNVPPNSTGGSADAIVVTHNHTLAGGSDTGTFLAAVSSLREGRKTGSTSTVDSITTTSASYTVNDKGSSGTNANIPPYYSLAYIMRTS